MSCSTANCRASSAALRPRVISRLVQAVAVPGIAVVFTGFNQPAGELVEQVGLFNQVAAGFGQGRQPLDGFFQCAVGGLLVLPGRLSFSMTFWNASTSALKVWHGCIQLLAALRRGGASWPSVFRKGCESFPQRRQGRDELRQGLDRLVRRHPQSVETGLAFIEHPAAVARHQVEEALGLAAVEPDDGQEVLLLLRAEVVDLAGDLAVDVARVDHEHLVAVRLRLVPIEEPQLAGHGAGVEEVGADGDHDIHIAGLDQLLAHLGLVAAGAGRLGRHDEAGAALFVQVAIEVADPEVVAVGDLVLLVHAGQAEGQARVVFDLVGVDLVHVEGRIGHHEVGLAEQFVRVFVVGDGLLDVALQPVDGQVHLGQPDGGGVLFQAVEGELFGGVLVHAARRSARSAQTCRRSRRPGRAPCRLPVR